MTRLVICNVPKRMDLNFDRFPISDGIVPLSPDVAISFDIENCSKNNKYRMNDKCRTIRRFIMRCKKKEHTIIPTDLQITSSWDNNPISVAIILFKMSTTPIYFKLTTWPPRQTTPSHVQWCKFRFDCSCVSGDAYEAKAKATNAYRSMKNLSEHFKFLPSLSMSQKTALLWMVVL